ncbi:MAG: phosphoglucosamine mutase [Oscillospiraceae bacterium]|nr:phosphoglucosamine mutase [Oscillospiraceae bacterium]
MGRLFGTDGARGVAVTELTCETAMQIGRAAAAVLCKGGKKAKVIIGKDTRVSSDIMEAALAAGLLSVGADAVSIGVVPTPAVAYLVGELHADAGVMISASHNSVEFNGIKLFSGDGYKLSDDIQDEIEALVLDTPEKLTAMQKNGKNVGRYTHDDTAVDLYIQHLLSTCESDIGSLRIAVDCANGSASATAEKLFGAMGLEKVYLLSCAPDGDNINDNCGSTHMDGLVKFVQENHCDLGFAFDGDADRCLAVDEDGSIVDGDMLIALFSKDMKERGLLKKDTAVVTVMTNIGFKFFARENDVNIVTTKVGDRYILEQMLQSDYNMGGEQSGHIIFKDYASTGDGQLTAVQALSVIKRTGKSLKELASVMDRFPQVMVNVRIAPEYKEGWKNIERIEQIIEEKEKALGNEGRVLVRESGTEPLIRVMIEGKQFDLINRYALEIADVIKECTAAV